MESPVLEGLVADPLGADPLGADRLVADRPVTDPLGADHGEDEGRPGYICQLETNPLTFLKRGRRSLFLMFLLIGKEQWQLSKLLDRKQMVLRRTLRTCRSLRRTLRRRGMKMIILLRVLYKAPLYYPKKIGNGKPHKRKKPKI